MTIMKSQGQTLRKSGINLSEPVFVHGQLYISLTRATKMDGVRIYQPEVILLNQEIHQDIEESRMLSSVKFAYLRPVTKFSFVTLD
jgi:ATP-dependent exoDNAse (exonuclease V) alpha subunit